VEESCHGELVAARATVGRRVTGVATGALRGCIRRLTANRLGGDARQRAILLVLGCAALVVAAAQGLTGVSELALYASPFLLLLGLLLSGRFVGEEAILARRLRPAPRVRPLPRRRPAWRERALVSLLERSPRLERGPPVVIAA
jgi:hypothetical protein